MESFFVKYRYLYLPYLCIAIGLMIGYPLFKWLTFSYFHWFSLESDWWDFVIPAALAFILVSVFLEPRFSILDLNRKKGDWNTFYFFITIFTLAIPVLFTQKYIKTSLSPLVHLNSLSEIETLPPARYYTVETCKIDTTLKIHSSSYSSVKKEGYISVSGDFSLVVPVFTMEQDSMGKDHPYWIGISFAEKIRTRENRDTEYWKSVFSFQEKCKKPVQYFRVYRKGDLPDEYIPKIKARLSGETPPAIYLFEAVYEPFEQMKKSGISRVFLSSGIGLSVFLFLTLPFKLRKDYDRYTW